MFKIEKLMRDEIAGDPVTGMRWTRKTTQKNLCGTRLNWDQCQI